MDLWQFVCYIDGYDAKCRQMELDYIVLAARIAAFNNATRRTSSDAKSQIKEIRDDIHRLLSDDDSSYKKNTNEEAKKEIDTLKKQLKYFK